VPHLRHVAEIIRTSPKCRVRKAPASIRANHGARMRSSRSGSSLAMSNGVRVCASVTVLLIALLSISAAASGPDVSVLQMKLEPIVGATRGEIGVALIHVESGARLSIHGDRPFPMASVYKLPIALELLRQIETGAL